MSSECFSAKNANGANKPEIAVLVSSYNKPRHLRYCLTSLAMQRGVTSPIEVVVTDDGSDAQTLDVIAETADEFSLAITLTTHAHCGFQLARCRNDGVRHSTAPYLLFVDGDCILPPDHVAIHLAHRRTGFVIGGDCCRLTESDSSTITTEDLRSSRYISLAPTAEIRRLRRRHWSAWWHRWIRHPRKPSLVGNNIGIWRADYERVNGYDEEFEGWGCEDDDLARRLRQCGIRIDSILHRTYTFHLWHAVDPTAPARWKEGRNVARLLADRPPVCTRGLRDLRDAEVRESLIPLPSMSTRVERIHPSSARSTRSRLRVA